MKKILAMIMAVFMTFGLTGCALLDFLHDNDNVVDLGDGENTVIWNLVDNDNAYRPVEEAYFAFVFRD